jgi:hypothetical protein
MAFQFPGSDVSMGSGGGDLWGAIGQIGSSLVDYTLQSKLLKKQARAMRGLNQGGSVMGFNPGTLGYSQGSGGWIDAARGALGIPSGGIFGLDNSPIDYTVPMGGVASGSSSTAGPFRVGAVQRVTPNREISVTGPNGKVYTWVYRGRPILYSGDLACARRVGKLLGRGRGAARRYTKSRRR